MQTLLNKTPRPLTENHESQCEWSVRIWSVCLFISCRLCVSSLRHYVQSLVHSLTHSLGLGRDRCGLMSMFRSIRLRASLFSCLSFSSIRESLCSSDDILKTSAAPSSAATHCPLAATDGNAAPSTPSSGQWEKSAKAKSFFFFRKIHIWHTRIRNQSLIIKLLIFHVKLLSMCPVESPYYPLMYALF